MNKLFMLSVLLLSSCTHNDPELTPKFALYDHVIYPVKAFYRNVCSGHGYINGLVHEVNTSITYIISPRDSFYPCPQEQAFLEGQLKFDESKEKE